MDDSLARMDYYERMKADPAWKLLQENDRLQRLQPGYQAFLQSISLNTEVKKNGKKPTKLKFCGNRVGKKEQNFGGDAEKST
ncbi:MAG: hypothetical protein U9Q21_02525 [Candidatus Auribacterota bacterium]|nr:hypothetical protein [Candidatus Auribacterota bacterium]